MEDSHMYTNDLIKKYGFVFVAIIWGALAHAISDIKAQGWRGAGWLMADIVVAGFIGYLFAHLASLYNPNLETVAGGIGGYMGPSAFKYVRSAFFNKLGLPETK